MKHGSVRQRDHSLDHVRLILICSVVFAHLLEVCAPFRGSDWLYQFIYSFHMPAFIFLFGYNARFSPRKLLYRWCIPYVIFQCAYILFSRAVLHVWVDFQFTTPYWLLWYMMACMAYQLLLPLFDTDDKNRQMITVVCAFLLALLVGFEETVGYYLSLSRFFVFLPWFLLGYYSKKNDLPVRLSMRPQRRRLILFASAAVMAVFAIFAGELPDGLLYGSYSYAGCEGSLWMRGGVFVVSFAAILLLCVGLRPHLSRKRTFLTGIGQNTWPIFLLHGFAVKAIPVYWPELVSSPWRVIFLSCGLVILVGNKFCSRALDCITFAWLEKYPGKNRLLGTASTNEN